MRALLFLGCLLAFPLALSASTGFSPFRDVSIEAMRETSAREFRPVGTTSVVYRVRFADGSKIAYRPAQRGRIHGHMAELAAYRLGAALGMENVPPVVLREESFSKIERLLDARFTQKHRERREKILRRGRDLTWGAAIHWVEDLTPSKLDKPRERERWLSALRAGGSRGDFPESLLRDLSRLVLFDYLVGNWDLMSGGNLQTDASGAHLYVRDHNLAFDHPLLPRHEAPLLERLERTQRFSRVFVERLRALDARRLAEVLAPDPLEPDRPILLEEQRAGVESRRLAILKHVEAMIAAHGEAHVLVFE